MGGKWTDRREMVESFLGMVQGVFQEGATSPVI